MHFKVPQHGALKIIYEIFFNYSISRQACKHNWQVGYVSLPEWIGKVAAQRGRVFMGSVQAQRSMKWSSQKMKLQRASQACSQACTRLFMGFCTCDGPARQHHISAGPQRAELLLPACVWLNSETCTAKSSRILMICFIRNCTLTQAYIMNNHFIWCA